MKFRVSATAALCLGLTLLSSCAREAPPDILLVVIDTLRADRLGVYGSTRGLTPFLDTLAARGTVFRNAYATSSWTPPSVASLFTSRFPSQHRVVRYDSKMSDEEVTLAEELAQRRYQSLGVSANPHVSAAFGFAQGFQALQGHPAGAKKLRGSHIRRKSLAWLDHNCKRAVSSPCFLYLHYMEPHAPYEPPARYRQRFRPGGGEVPDAAAANRKLLSFALSQLSDAEIELLSAYYDGEVAAVDAELRILFDELERRGFLDNAIVVITADHGEEFKDHGWMSHGTALYNETIRVPLVLLAPGFAGGRVIDENVSLLDVAPTLLDLVGLPREPRFEGHSLVCFLRPRSLLARARVWFAPSADQAEGWDNLIVELEATGADIDFRRHTAGLIRGAMKLLVNQVYDTTEIFDLAKDPAEGDPKPSEADALSTILGQALDELRADLHQRAVVAGERRSLDEATKEKLRALGYHF